MHGLEVPATLTGPATIGISMKIVFDEAFPSWNYRVAPGLMPERATGLQNSAPDSLDDDNSTVRGEGSMSTAGTCGGLPRIAGHRIKVAEVVIWYERMGLKSEEIVSTRPTL